MIASNAITNSVNNISASFIPASHDDISKQFFLSKSSLIGFEMDYFNQTVNLRHVASVDR